MCWQPGGAVGGFVCHSDSVVKNSSQDYPNLEDKQGKIFQENAFKFGFYNDEILQQSRQFL